MTPVLIKQNMDVRILGRLNSTKYAWDQWDKCGDPFFEDLKKRANIGGRAGHIQIIKGVVTDHMTSRNFCNCISMKEYSYTFISLYVRTCLAASVLYTRGCCHQITNVRSCWKYANITSRKKNTLENNWIYESY